MKVIAEAIVNCLQNAQKDGKQLTLRMITEVLIQQGVVKATRDMSVVLSKVRSHLYIMMEAGEVVQTERGTFNLILPNG